MYDKKKERKKETTEKQNNLRTSKIQPNLESNKKQKMK